MTIRFSDLQALLGQRIDSPVVQAFAAAQGVKLPLKSTTDGNSSNAFTLKKLGIEVAWSHDILLPAFFPPQKQNRKYVAYVNHIWMDLDVLDAVPAAVRDLAVQLHALAQPGGLAWPAESPLPVRVYKGFGDGIRLALADHERYGWLRSEVHPHAYSPWDPLWPPEQADLAMGMLMAWAILRGDVGQRHQDAHPEWVAAVRERRMTGREFLYQAAHCNEVWSWDFAPQLHHFLRRYIRCGCHRNSTLPLLGRADRCGLDDDFSAVFDALLPHRCLQAADDWANFDRFACLLDARWRDFELTGLETKLDKAQAAELKPVYVAAGQAMAALPTPVGLDLAPTVIHAPDDLTHRLMTSLGTRTDDDRTRALLVALGFEAALKARQPTLDAPQHGFFVHLSDPWSMDSPALAVQASPAERQKLKRHGVKCVQGLEFTPANVEQIGNSTGGFLLTSAYGHALPLGFSFDEALAEADARLGLDLFEERVGLFEGQITRAWKLDAQAQPTGPDSPVDHLRVIAKYTHGQLGTLRVLIR